MDFKEQIRELGKRVLQYKDRIKTEEGTKTSLIVPFLKILGFEVSNPMEVEPEFVADVGAKKGEKVDYAIFKDGQPILLVECKHCALDLNPDNEVQLYRYFQACKSKFALLTNGIKYQFYTDLEEKNVMDRKPFLQFDITNMKDAQIAELKKFTKTEFNEELISNTAAELKYTSALREYLAKQLKDPDEEFTRPFASAVYCNQGNRRLTSGVIKMFQQLLKKTLDSYLMDMIKDSLNSALAAEKAKEEQAKLQEAENQAEQAPESEIVTTEEELEGYQIVKAIVCQKIPASRVVIDDKKAYCNILLDGMWQKPICRFYYNAKRKKYLALFNLPNNFKGVKKVENRVELSAENPNDDIYKFSDALLQTIDYYEHPELVPDAPKEM